MYFDSYSIARKRYRMRKTLRFAALVCLTIAVAVVAWSIARALINWNSNARSLVLAILDGVSFFAAAGFLLAVERWGIRLVVPPAPRGCPNCAYPVDPAKSPRCPECGTHCGTAAESPSN